MDRQRLIREGIFKLIPRRKAQGRQGRKPTLYTKELSGARKRMKGGGVEEENGNVRNLDEDTKENEEEEDTSKWWKYHREYTATEKKLLNNLYSKTI